MLSATAQAGLDRLQSHQLTPAGEYTFGIEGPAVDAKGNRSAVNFGKSGTIGILPAGATASKLYLTLPQGSIANSIRFDRDGRMFIADYRKHTIFVIEPGSTELKTYFHSDDFNQPNDMTVAADGTIYASDPNFKRRSGQVWRIRRGPDGNGIGERMTSERPMTTTNGIELSSDGSTLYVGESETREIWAYRIDGTRLTSPRLVKKFPDLDIDGIRADMDGTLYVARLLKGTIAVLSLDGQLLREIPTSAKEPTNLAFGGPDGKTLYITESTGAKVLTADLDVAGKTMFSGA
jgi:signal peptidase